MADIVTPVVRERNGELYADSRDVAVYFDREHRHIVAQIDSLPCSAQFLTVNFCTVKYQHRGNTYKYYEMTREGFVFLMMRMSGNKAARLQEAYIMRFKEMEDALKTILDNRMTVAQHDLHKHAIECRLSEEKARIAATALNERKKEIKWLARIELELREKYQLELI